MYQEIIGYLFTDNSSDAIGHYVSQCLTMSNGITLQLCIKFKNIDTLIKQQKQSGKSQFSNKKKQWVLYLITKI